MTVSRTVAWRLVPVQPAARNSVNDIRSGIQLTVAGFVAPLPPKV